jgi:hypothetical protein
LSASGKLRQNNRLESGFESNDQAHLLNCGRAWFQAFLTRIPESSVVDSRDLQRFPLTTISATASQVGYSLTQLIAGASSAPQTPPAASTNSDSTSTATSPDGFGAAAFVTLSEQAKQAVATKAVSDQAAADQLQTYVEAHHVSTANAASQESSLQSIFSGGAWSTSGQPQTPTSGTKIQAIVAQIQTLADANEPPPFQAFTPTKSLSNSVTFDGYTLSVDTNASTQFYGILGRATGPAVAPAHLPTSRSATKSSTTTKRWTLSRSPRTSQASAAPRFPRHRARLPQARSMPSRRRSRSWSITPPARSACSKPLRCRYRRNRPLSAPRDRRSRHWRERSGHATNLIRPVFP